MEALEELSSASAEVCQLQVVVLTGWLIVPRLVVFSH